MNRLTVVALVLMWGGSTAIVPGAESDGYRYYSIPGDSMALTEGEWPVATDETRGANRALNRAQRRAVNEAMQPYVILDGKGEAFATVPRGVPAPEARLNAGVTSPLWQRTSLHTPPMYAAATPS